MFKTFIALLCGAGCLRCVPAMAQLSFESGAVVNRYVAPEGLYTKHQSSAGYFFKMAYNRQLLAKNNWRLSMTLGGAYLRYTDGCTTLSACGNKDKFTGSRYDDVTFYFGPQLAYQQHRLRAGGALVLNGLLNARTQTEKINFVLNAKRTSAYNFGNTGLYASAQAFILYKPGKRLWIGPALNLFFYDLPYGIGQMNAKRNSSAFHKGNTYGIDGKNMLMNPGILIQIDLK